MDSGALWREGRTRATAGTAKASGALQPTSYSCSASNRRAHSVRFKHSIQRVVRGRRYLELAPQLDDLTSQPWQLEPVAAFEIQRHRCLHGRRGMANEVEDPLEGVRGQRNAVGASDFDHFPKCRNKDRTNVGI